MKATKKNSTMPMVSDLFVKLANLFGDAYLLMPGGVIIAGEKQPERILGTVMCTLEPQYLDAIKKLLFDPNGQCYYIPDVVAAKKFLQEKAAIDWEPTPEVIEEFDKNHMIEKHDEEVVKEQHDKASMIERKVFPENGNVKWIECVGENIELVNTIFELNSIFDYPVDNPADEKNPEPKKPRVVTLAKQLFPLMNEKNIENAYIGTTGKRDNESDELLELVVDFRFTHFRMVILYKVIILPWEPDKSDSETEVSE